MAQQVRGVVARSKDAPVERVTINVSDPGPGEAVVKVGACGVCHTDLHNIQGGIGDDYPCAAFAKMDSGNVLRSVVVM